MKRSVFLLMVALVIVLSSCRTIPVEEENAYQKILTYAVDQEQKTLPIQPKYLLVYYSAQWCPYCVEYETQLKNTYTQLKGLYGNDIEIIFAGHINDQDNETLLAFLENGEYPFAYIPYERREQSGVMDLLGEHRFYIPGFILLDKRGAILSSSSGETRDDYLRDRPLYHLQSILMQDCASCQK